MSYSDPTHLGIIACPGAEVFANQVIRKLSGIYKHRFARKAQAIAGRYHITPELVIRKINFANDCNTACCSWQGTPIIIARLNLK
jgi:hypothetical protein